MLFLMFENLRNIFWVKLSHVVCGRLCRYFDGRHHLEEMMFYENIRRSQLLIILDKFYEILVISHHEEPNISYWLYSWLALTEIWTRKHSESWNLHEVEKLFMEFTTIQSQRPSGLGRVSSRAKLQCTISKILVSIFRSLSKCNRSFLFRRLPPLQNFVVHNFLG